MSSKPFPDSHTTQTSATTTTTTTTVIVRPYLEFSYIRTVPGILKIVELVLDFLVFICLVAGPTYLYSGIGWATFVSITAFISTMILLWLYLFHIIELYNIVPWLLVELIMCAIFVLMFFTASSVAAAGAASLVNFNPGPFAAAAFFGFMAMFCYGFDCFLKFQAWRNGVPPQGPPRASSTMHSTATIH
jgi:hypothetical protein